MHLLPAHGVGGRSDLPAPLWLAMYSAGLVVLVSFLVLVTLWHNPRFRGSAAGRPLPEPLQTLARSAVPRVALRVVGLLLFVATILTLALGGDDAATNPAPTWIFVWLWVGVPLLSVLVGPVWGAVNPLRTITAGLRAVRPGAGARTYPQRLGYWPAAANLLIFVWIELVYRQASLPSTLLVYVLVYSVVHVGFGLRYGQEWFARADGFEVYSELMGRLSVLGRRPAGGTRNGPGGAGGADPDDELVLRLPFNGLASLRPRDSLVAVVCVLLGSTAFDGFARSAVWTAWSNRFNHQPANALLGTAGLVASIGLVTTLFVAATVGGRAVRTTVRQGTNLSLPALFAHSLLPIVLGYAVAHYFSFLMFQGQEGYLLASDPFNLGWHVLGPPGRGIDYQVVSTTVIGFVQVAAIVLGHVTGVISAHDRAMEVFPGAHRIRAQIPLVIVMIVFTFTGIGLVTGTG